jgi:hypothetical protein
MKSLGAVLLLLVLTAPPAGATQFAFGAFGDAPYGAHEEAHFLTMIAQMNRQKLAFSIHVGDFKAAQSECSDTLFTQRLEWFELSQHPFFYIPGDNEWIDCTRARRAPHDPIERLAKLRELFYPSGRSLGQRHLGIERQNERYPEHMRWITGDVLFATLNVPGADNNRRMPAESGPRTAAVLEWITNAFRIARERGLPALVIAMHANPLTGNPGYREIVDALVEHALGFPGEVLLVHGDTHRFRFDRPLVDRRSGRRVENVQRLEVFGSPFVDWVYVSVSIEERKARFEAVRGSDKAAREE